MGRPNRNAGIRRRSVRSELRSVQEVISSWIEESVPCDQRPKEQGESIANWSLRSQHRPSGGLNATAYHTSCGLELEPL